MRFKFAENVVTWLAEYLGAGRRGRRIAIVDTEGLRRFLETRSNHVAQTSLYGYLRTRAGTRYPELFENAEFIRSINIAKWQIWLACLSDLAVYAGGLVFREGRLPADRVTGLIQSVVAASLASTGTPPDAGPAYADGARHVIARLEGTNWSTVTDGEGPFCESPDALVEWAPIVDELKQYDAEIVKNSIRFRWQEIRRDLRRDLDVEAMARSLR